MDVNVSNYAHLCAECSNSLKPRDEEIVLEIYNNNLSYKHSSKARSKSEIKWICLHYTAGPNASAKTEIKVMSKQEAASHFCVDEKGIYPMVPLEYAAWHMGDGYCKDSNNNNKSDLERLANKSASDWRYDVSAKFHLNQISTNTDKTVKNMYSIGIDLCVKKDNPSGKLKATDTDWRFESKAVEKTAHLVAYLMQEYNVDYKHIIRHCECTGKPCPRPFVSLPGDGDNKFDLAWEEFINKVKSYSENNKYVIKYKNDAT